ncbi:MAG: flagellar motor protein [Deltaproteobacteria bacterium]|nr:flagellar motor protein [Deltaproteobacteria bacterium]
MDKATLIGLCLGGAALLGGHLLEGGSAGTILQLTAMVIVFGGTLGAVCVSFGGAQLRQAWRELPHIFRKPRDETPDYLTRLVELSYRARREGLLSLEGETKKIPDPFFRRGLELVIDAHQPQQVREIMEVELARLEETGSVPAQVFESAGGYAPTVGILGAVLGLIQVMQHLTEPAKLGTGVAVAFVATIYGVASANLVFLPIAHKFRLRQQHQLRLREMILEGLLALARGDHPRLLAERLRGFLEPDARLDQERLAPARLKVLRPGGRPRTKPHASPSPPAR